MKYALIGKPLAHSQSAFLHQMLGTEGYLLYQLGPDELEGFLRDREFSAINVTIPYKQTVAPLLDALHESAKLCGAVNTVINDGGRLIGYNTDIIGLDYAFKKAGMSLTGKSIAILGSGGTSHTVSALAKLKEARRVAVVSRTGEVNYSDLSALADCDFVVNATPVGMYPDIAASPVDLKRFPAAKGCFDAVYNPLFSRLRQQAAALGIPSADGIDMLAAQAFAAHQLFEGRPYAPIPLESPSGRATDRAAAELRKSLSNLVLIGMPGSGKTTVGRMVAELTGREFFDVDEEIVESTGMSVYDIFAKNGEAGFRRLEAETIKRVSLRQGIVIATGGGAVLREENRLNLKANGYIVHIRRKLEQLSGEGRPLSRDAEAIAALERERAPIYEAMADATIFNGRAPEEAAYAVKEVFNEGFGR